MEGRYQVNSLSLNFGFQHIQDFLDNFIEILSGKESLFS